MGRLRFWAARNYLILFGWEAGTRTPIARSRVWSPTIGRPPRKRNLNLRIEAPLVNLTPQHTIHLYLIVNIRQLELARCCQFFRLRRTIFPVPRFLGNCPYKTMVWPVSPEPLVNPVRAVTDIVFRVEIERLPVLVIGVAGSGGVISVMVFKQVSQLSLPLERTKGAVY